jgi:hypothetical protein
MVDFEGVTRSVDYYLFSSQTVARQMFESSGITASLTRKFLAILLQI